MNKQTMIAYGCAGSGLACGIGAAAIHGGWFAALTAASVALNGFAGVLGYLNKSAAP